MICPVRNQENVTSSQGSRRSMTDANLKMIQMLELSDKDFKASSITEGKANTAERLKMIWNEWKNRRFCSLQFINHKKKKKNQTDILESKNTVSEVKKNSLDGQWAEKRVHKLGGGSIEIIQCDEQRERKEIKKRRRKKSQGPVGRYQNTSHSCHWGSGERPGR